MTVGPSMTIAINDNANDRHFSVEIMYKIINI